MTRGPGAALRPSLQDAAAQALATPNGAAYTAWLLLHLGLWALGVALIVHLEGRWSLQLLLAVLLGSQLHTLTVLQHDCGHLSAYRSRAANRWVGRLLAAFILMPFTTFTEVHRRHHGFLGQPGKDPDEWFYAAGSRQLFWRECLFMPRFIWLSLSGWLPAAVRPTVIAELAANSVLHGTAAALLLHSGRADVLAFGVLLPMLLLGLVFNPLSRGYEHYPMARLHRDDPRRRQLRHNTQTSADPMLGFLWANIAFHVEHHLHPRVPFYRLRAVHRLLAQGAGGGGAR
jgi:fatty acid desaturase